MQQFRIPLSGIMEIQRKTRLQTILLYLILTIAGIVFLNKDIASEDGDTLSLSLSIICMVALMSLGYFLTIKRNRATLASFLITVSDDKITREQMKTTTISIAINDIEEIRKDKDGNLEIKDTKSKTVIYAPAQIDNYSELIGLLSTFKPIKEKFNKPILQKYSFIYALLVIGLMFTVIISANKILVGFAGTGFVAIMAWSYYEAYRSQHIDQTTKKKMYWGYW